MPPKLTLAMIVRDEEENLAVCLKSVAAHVDEIVIVDTGSVDKTREVATRFGASVYQFDSKSHPHAFFTDDEKTCTEFGAPPPYSGDIALGDFAAARNESFKHATGDYVFWLDADDVLEKPELLRAVVADMEARRLDIGFLPYDYARDNQGRVFWRQWRERVIKKETGLWLNPVHEVYMPHRPNPAHARFEFPLVAHHRKADRRSIPNRNYKNLLRQAWQVKTSGAPMDPRTLFYLGQEARFVEPMKAAGFYNEYLKTSGWAEERSAAHVALGSLFEFGQLNLPPDDALLAAHREFSAAFAEMPENPDGVLGLARVAYLKQRWQDCVNYSERGLKTGNPDTMLGGNPMDRLYRPHVYYSIALANVGRLEEAIVSCKAGLAVAPDDPGIPGGAPGMLKHNLVAFEQALRERDQKSPETKPSLLLDKNEDIETPPANVPRDAMIIWAMQLWKQIVASGDGARAHAFLEALPTSLYADPIIGRMVASTHRRFNKAPIEVEDVVFYLGQGVEPWDPTTPNTQGLGGSETAAIEMAKNFAALGRDVVVYAEAEGVFDHVRYVHHSKFRGALCDVFIASRTPWAVMELGPVDANLKLLWVHDIHCGPPSPQMERWLYAFDRVLCLSNFHKDFFCKTYPTLDPARVVVTRNGIDPTRFAELAKKENRMVFSSSPNRGLPALLHSLKEIKKSVPDVHLDIFYGFETWETMMKAQGNQQQLDEIAQYKKMIAEAVASGVATFHGRRPQSEVAAAYLRAKVWGYPTEFPETSCITAMEAQAAGCVPICTRFGALPETVKHGVLIDPPECNAKFIAACVELLTQEDIRFSYAQPARQWALENLSWSSLAAEWIKMFDTLKIDLEKNPIQAWRKAS